MQLQQLRLAGCLLVLSWGMVTNNVHVRNTEQNGMFLVSSSSGTCHMYTGRVFMQAATRPGSGGCGLAVCNHHMPWSMSNHFLDNIILECGAFKFMVLPVCMLSTGQTAAPWPACASICTAVLSPWRDVQGFADFDPQTATGL